MAPDAAFWVVASLGLWLAVAVVLVAMAVVDARSRRIPNGLVAAVCGLWVLLQSATASCAALTGEALAAAAQTLSLPQPLLHLFALPDPLTGVLTALGAVAVLAGVNALFEKLSHNLAMGAGDVKLIGVFALFLGPFPTMACLALACLFALVAALPARARTFPFAPALTLAFVCVMLVEL